MNRGGSNIKQWVLLGRNKIKRVWECLRALGYWTRGNPEMCLLATKGSPKRLSKSVKQLVISPRREHSRKHDEIYNYIEDLLDGLYVELFARTKRKGWDSWEIR